MRLNPEILDFWWHIFSFKKTDICSMVRFWPILLVSIKNGHLLDGTCITYIQDLISTESRIWFLKFQQFSTNQQTTIHFGNFSDFSNFQDLGILLENINRWNFKKQMLDSVQNRWISPQAQTLAIEGSWKCLFFIKNVSSAKHLKSVLGMYWHPFWTH